MRPALLLLGSLIAIVVMCMCSGCETTAQAHMVRNVQRWARVTFYNPTERDLVGKGRHKHWVCYGRHTASGARARQGVTLAAPKWVPFGTKVFLPKLQNVVGSGVFTVQDRGAGDRKLHTPEWFDVFVDNKSTMRKLQYGIPEWMEYELRY